MGFALLFFVALSAPAAFAPVALADDFCAPEGSVVSDEGFARGTGFEVALNCDYQCTGKTAAHLDATASFMPEEQGLIEGDGGILPQRGQFMYGSLTARLSAWSREICLARAEALCGGIGSVVDARVAREKIGNQSFTVPFGCASRDQTVLNPFAKGSAGKPAHCSEMSLGNSLSAVASVPDRAVANRIAQSAGSRSEPGIGCRHSVAVTVCYGDCMLDDGSLPICPAKPMGVAEKDSFCVDALETEIQKSELRQASEAVLTAACESYFSRLAAHRRFQGSSCNAFRGDPECAVWAHGLAR